MLPRLHRVRPSRSGGWTPGSRVPAAALVALIVTLAITAAGSGSASAALAPCTAAAEAGAGGFEGSWSLAAGSPLSTPLTIEVTCDMNARVEVRTPGNGVSEHLVRARAPLRIEDERAYLCQGHDALVDISSPGLGWFQSVSIGGIDALPQCDVLLKRGSTRVRWSGPAVQVDRAFAGGTPGSASWSLSSQGVVPGLSVWSIVEGEPLHAVGWGDGVPPVMRGLSRLATGAEYLVISEVERAWTFPRPHGGGSLFDRAQVVAFYGFPGVPVMGALGKAPPAEVAAEVAAWAEHYDRLNGDREVIPAFHLITAVAQAHQTSDGTYLARMSDERIERYVEAAREHGMLLFLDVQIGWSDPLTEVLLLDSFLREPFVHLALDPEFATLSRGQRPGLVIGSIEAEQINEVQHYLAGLIEEEGLPPKILVIHQFTDWMILDGDQVEDVDGVEVTIDMDGFGSIALKLKHFERYSLVPPAERSAIKLFFRQDQPIMSPEQIQALPQLPDLIIYH